jgi:hypothetical protein
MIFRGSVDTELCPDYTPVYRSAYISIVYLRWKYNWKLQIENYLNVEISRNKLHNHIIFL